MLHHRNSNPGTRRAILCISWSILFYKKPKEPSSLVTALCSIFMLQIHDDYRRGFWVYRPGDHCPLWGLLWWELPCNAGTSTSARTWMEDSTGMVAEIWMSSQVQTSMLSKFHAIMRNVYWSYGWLDQVNMATEIEAWCNHLFPGYCHSKDCGILEQIPVRQIQQVTVVHVCRCSLDTEATFCFFFKWAVFASRMVIDSDMPRHRLEESITTSRCRRTMELPSLLWSIKPIIVTAVL